MEVPTNDQVQTSLMFPDPGMVVSGVFDPVPESQPEVKVKEEPFESKEAASEAGKAKETISEPPDVSKLLQTELLELTTGNGIIQEAKNIFNQGSSGPKVSMAFRVTKKAKKAKKEKKKKKKKDKEKKKKVKFIITSKKTLAAAMAAAEKGQNPDEVMSKLNAMDAIGDGFGNEKKPKGGKKKKKDLEAPPTMIPNWNIMDEMEEVLKNKAEVEDNYEYDDYDYEPDDFIVDDDVPLDSSDEGGFDDDYYDSEYGRKKKGRKRRRKKDFYDLDDIKEEVKEEGEELYGEDFDPDLVEKRLKRKNKAKKRKRKRVSYSIDDDLLLEEGEKRKKVKWDVPNTLPEGMRLNSMSLDAYVVMVSAKLPRAEYKGLRNSSVKDEGLTIPMESSNDKTNENNHSLQTLPLTEDGTVTQPETLVPGAHENGTVDLVPVVSSNDNVEKTSNHKGEEMTELRPDEDANVKQEGNEEEEEKVIKQLGDRKIYGCVFCSYTGRKQTWIAHLKSKHKDKNIVFCDKTRACNMPFESQDLLDKHMEENHKQKNQCNVCNKCFKFPSALRNHMQRHIGEDDPDKRKHICPYCGKKFSTRTGYRSHEAHNHTMNLRHKCDWNGCTKAYYNLSDLKIHKRGHTGECPYTCSYCGAGFVARQRLVAHEKVMHLQVGKLDVECPVCHKTIRKKHLPYHLKTHQGLTKDWCSVCGKEFPTTAGKRRHEKIHFGQKDYACRFCGKAFVQKANMDAHERIHTGEKPYGCKYCGECFVQGTRRNMHQSTCRHKPMGTIEVKSGVSAAV